MLRAGIKAVVVKQIVQNNATAPRQNPTAPAKDNTYNSNHITISVSFEQKSKVNRLIDSGRHSVIKKIRENMVDFGVDTFYELLMNNKLGEFLDKHPRIKEKVLDKVKGGINDYISAFMNDFRAEEHAHVTKIPAAHQRQAQPTISISQSHDSHVPSKQKSKIDRLIDSGKHSVIKKIRENMVDFGVDTFYELLMNNKLGEFLDSHPRIKDKVLSKVKGSINDCISAFMDDFHAEEHAQTYQRQAQPTISTNRSNNTHASVSPASAKTPPAAFRPIKTPAATRPVEAPIDWIVNHQLMANSSEETKLGHIFELISNESKAGEIQKQLTHPHPTYGRFVDIIKTNSLHHPQILCMFLANFEISSEEIRSFANTPRLKDNVRKYISTLPASKKNQDFLTRCLDRRCSLGALCHTSRLTSNFFVEPQTIITVRAAISRMEKELASNPDVNSSPTY